MRPFLLSAFLISLFVKSHAQNQSAADIAEGISSLKTTGSVLYIAAHPDDENTRLIAYLVKEKKLRTGYLSLTRGDGGQNLVGSEQGASLGLLRTHELLAARKVDGGEQFFTRANDFGYSKNPEETFSFWSHDSILSDVVRVIRTFRPDIIICRFPTTGEGGHGHHTASAILAVEAFSAAADPSRFSEQLPALSPWQAKQIFWNTFNFGTNNTTSKDQITEDVGTYNRITGKSYGEIAAESRSMHRSQGFGTLSQRGTQIEYFKWLAGEPAGKSVLSLVPADWSRFPKGSVINKLIEKAISDFSLLQPSASIPQLWKIRESIAALRGDQLLEQWKRIKLETCDNLILQCAGIWCEAVSQDQFAVTGVQSTASVQVLNRSSTNVTVLRIHAPGYDTTMNAALRLDEILTVKHRMPAFSQPSVHYWLKHPSTDGLYAVPETSMRGRPLDEPVHTVNIDLRIATSTLTVRRAVIYRYADPSRGERHRPLQVLPRATVNFTDRSVLFSASDTKTITATVHANISALQGTLMVESTAGYRTRVADPVINIRSKGDEQTFAIVIDASAAQEAGELRARLLFEDGTSSSLSATRLQYDHIPEQFLLRPAVARVFRTSLSIGSAEIGYVPGAGDDVPAALTQAGYHVTLLTGDLLEKTDLGKFSAIVTGVRAYNTNEKLQSMNEKLLAYVHNGGNLIVQYNTNSRVGPLNARIGPFPFTISRDRVTDQTAEIRVTDSSHTALLAPNKITAADFSGWIQERGIYFAAESDKRYKTPLSMNDPGEKPHEGSLLIAEYGKGNFVYTGLAFFRQLPAGVPGAFRLFANLLALPRHAASK